MPRSGPQPLFHGVTRHLTAKIEAGEYAAGDRLPTERWLQQTLGVSRTTVRRAIEELVEAGTLELRGRAAYVAKPALDAPQRDTILSLTDMARERGLVPTARVLMQQVRPATLDEADAFRIAPGAELFELRRLRLLDGAAISIDHDRTPLKTLPQGPQLDFTHASYFESLARAGSPPVHSRMQIEARLATSGEAELLGLPPGAPVLVNTEQASGPAGYPVSLGYSVFRSDRHRFLVQFTRSAKSR
ncbi:MAG: GntR family transcriptional regulator [Alphaproteobacteria bacterium]|nr:GntR family transcriptional regulator [Alphaproteobacteria bacterium]